ncbi:MAG: TPM domain-containing protein, partial [Psychrobacillus sp.]
VKILGDKLKKGTTAQLVVMIIEHVGDQSASEFNMDIIRENQIGSVRNKNGLLFLIETDPVNGGGPAVEITVDRDLEKALSDAKIDQIIERYTMPYLNQGLIDEAVISTYQALSYEVSKHYGISEGLTKPQPYTSNSLQDSISIPTIIIILLVIFLLSRMVNGKRKKQRD